MPPDVIVSEDIMGKCRSQNCIPGLAYKEWGPQWVDMNWEMGEVPSWPLDWGALTPFTPRKEYRKADRRGGVREVKDSHKRVCLKWWSLASSSPDGKGKGEGGKNKTSGYLTVCIPESHTLESLAPQTVVFGIKQHWHHQKLPRNAESQASPPPRPNESVSALFIRLVQK